MANIKIYRHNYEPDSSATAQYAGLPPMTATASLASLYTTLASGSTGNFIGLDSTYGDPEFKDHKTIFHFNNTSGSQTTVTFKAGTKGKYDKDVTIPAGECDVWIDSSPYVDKVTGAIKVVTTVASVACYGVELR